MEFNSYIRRPFVVEAVEITEENLEEVAKYVGEVKSDDEGNRYIRVDRRLVPALFKVYPGFYFTRMGDKHRCYTPEIFAKQFADASPEVMQWVDYLNSEDETEQPKQDEVEGEPDANPEAIPEADRLADAGLDSPTL